MSTARSKRSHASGSSSAAFGASNDFLAMTSKPKKSKKLSQAQVRKYLKEVGWFVTMFAIVEHNVHETLRHYVGISPVMAACIFSGTRMDGAISYLKRIAEATNWPAQKKNTLNHISSQLGEITQLRNDLLHYGVSNDHPDAALVITNKKYAHVESRIRTTRISTEILKDAIFDLMIILVGLSVLTDEFKIPEMEEVEKAFKL
jgi:hypothetical protein